MGLTPYGPDEAWPAHGKPFWRKALDKARNAGWRLEYLGAPHTYGVVKCPAGEHSAKVDCTAKAGESYAIDLEKAVRDCGHGAAAGSKVAGRLESANELLTRSEQLVGKAEGDLVLATDRVEAHLQLERLWALLATAEATAEAAENLGDLDPATATPLPGQREQQEVLDRAAATESAPLPESVAETLDQAHETADDAAELVRRILRPGLAKPLRVRTKQVHDRIEAVRGQLERLEDQIGTENP